MITNDTVGTDGGGVFSGATKTSVRAIIACNRAVNRGGGMFVSGIVALDGD